MTRYRLPWRLVFVLCCLGMFTMVSMLPIRAEAPPLPAAIAKLKDENPLTRSDAAKALGKSGDARVVPLLLPLLNDESISVRAATVCALGELHDPQAIDPLLAELEKPQLGVGSQVIEALGQFKDPRITKVLLMAVKDPNAAIRVAAITSLGNYRDPAVYKPIFSCLLDNDATVRLTVVKALEKQPPDPLTGPSLIALLNSETNTQVQIALINALGHLRVTGAESPLFNVVIAEDHKPNRNYQINSAVEQALIHIGGPSLDLILAKLREPAPDNQADPEAAERYRCARALALTTLSFGMLHTPRLRAALLEIVQQNGNNDFSFDYLLNRTRDWYLIRSLDGVYPDSFSSAEPILARRVREPWCRDPLIVTRCRARLLMQHNTIQWDAINALREMMDPSVIPDLLPFLDSKDPTERLISAAVLARLKNMRAIVILMELATDKDSTLKPAAMQYLRDLPELEDVQPLLTFLKAKPEVKWLDVLALSGDGRFTPSSIEMLQTPDEKVRARVAYTLATSRDRRAVAPLVNLLKTGPESFRVTAAAVLGQIGDKSAVEPLVKALPGASDRLTARIAQSLLLLHDPRGVEPLLRLLNGKDVAARGYAVGALCTQCGLKEPRFVEPVLAVYRDTKDVLSKDLSPLAALIVYGDSRAVPTLLAALDDPENDYPWSRQRIVRALGTTGDKRAADKLFAIACDDMDSRVVTEAALSLQDIGDPRAADLLLRLAVDPFCMGHNSALAALADLNDPRVVKVCAGLLQDDDPLTCALAARALIRKKDPRGIETLITLLGKVTEETTLLATTRFLGEAKEPRAVAPLLAMLPKATPAERIAIATAFGNIGDKRVVPSLCARLQDHYPAVRYAAEAALKTLTGKDYSAEANKW